MDFDEKNETLFILFINIPHTQLGFTLANTFPPVTKSLFASKCV